MSDDEDDLFDWNPFDKIEEDRDVLEKIAAARKAAEDREFPRHLLTSDPVWAREVIQRSKAEKAKENARDDTVPAPEIPAREATPEEWPGAAKTLIKKFDAAWRYKGWFMRGPQISGGRVLGIRSAFVLAAEEDYAEHPRRIRVIFHLKDDGKWDRKNNWIFVREANVPWQIAPSVKALEAYVAGERNDLPAHAPIPLEGL